MISAIFGIKMYRIIAGLAALCTCAAAEPAWTRSSNADFEIWSDAGPRAVNSTLAWFEQLRAFSREHLGVAPARVTIVLFHWADEYTAFRPIPEASAFCASSGGRHYIVMFDDPMRASATAAHEYAHILMHAGSVHLPRWFSEGLAEIYSTLRIGPRSSTIGGDLPPRSAQLSSGPWMPLPELLAVRDEPGDQLVFYAQSWALTRMLMFSPDYAPRFPALALALASGTPSERALTETYGKTAAIIARDLQAWAVPNRFRGVSLGGIRSAPCVVTTVSPTDFERQRLMADILFASGAHASAPLPFTPTSNARRPTIRAFRRFSARWLFRRETGWPR